MNHTLPAMSTNESNFITRALEAGVRVDNRQRLESRVLSMTLSELGGVELRLGETKILASATAELVEPYADRPSEGLLQFFVDFSPMASPAFEPGRASEPAVELMRLLERTVRKSQAIDIESLCVVAGRRVWSVRCDITVLDHRGNLTDATVLAALGALKHLRLPAVRIDGAGDEASVSELPPDQADPEPLVFHHLPVAVSFGFFRSAEGGPLVSALDPTDREEQVMLGSMTAVLNQHQELCSLHKPGGVPLPTAELLESVQQAAVVVPQRLRVLEATLQAHAERVAAVAEVLRRTGRLPTRSLGAGAAVEVDAGPPAGAADDGVVAQQPRKRKQQRKG